MATPMNDQRVQIAQRIPQGSSPADEASATITRTDGIPFVATSAKVSLKQRAGKIECSIAFGFSENDGAPCNARPNGKVILMLGAERITRSRLTAGRTQDTVFVLDSGAAVHVTGNYNLFCYMTAVPQGRVVRAANGHTLPVEGSGSVVMDGFRLKYVLYVPGLTRNLVSVSMLADLDYSIQFGKAECYVFDTRPGGAMVGKGHLVSGIYVLEYLQIPFDRVPAPGAALQQG